jgi:hypothetical protein
MAVCRRPKLLCTEAAPQIPVSGDEVVPNSRCFFSFGLFFKYFLSIGAATHKNPRLVVWCKTLPFLTKQQGCYPYPGRVYA